MFDFYPVLVKRNDHREVTGYFYPDFCYEYPLTEDNIGNANSLSQSIIGILQDHISTHYHNKPMPFPKSIQDYQLSIVSSSNDLWTQCPINNQGLIKKFERFLPPFGVFSSIITAATMAVLDFKTTQTQVGASTGMWVGSGGAVFSAIMAVIIYYFSDAGKISRIIGRKLDNCCTPLNHDSLSPQAKNKNYKHRIATLIPKVSVTTIPIITTLFTSYSHYTQVMSIINKELNDRNSIEATIFRYLVLVMTIFSGYSKLFFQLSFMPPIYEKVDRFINKKIFLTSNTSINHEPSAESTGLLIPSIKSPVTTSNMKNSNQATEPYKHCELTTDIKSKTEKDETASLANC